MENLLVVKTDNYIMVSCNGKRFIVDSQDNRFNLLKDKDNNEIKLWYLNYRKGGEVSG